MSQPPFIGDTEKDVWCIKVRLYFLIAEELVLHWQLLFQLHVTVALLAAHMSLQFPLHHMPEISKHYICFKICSV
jgi:hypothetical protein